MYRIAICDDVATVCSQICALLAASPLSKSLELTVFHSGVELKRRLDGGATFDLIILDIELDEVDGIALGRFVRETRKDSVTQLLYISGKRQYAMELFDMRPLNFLLKPICGDKLLHCVEQAMELSRPGNRKVSFTSNRHLRQVPCQTIRYVESYNKRLTIHTTEGDFHAHGKLSDLARQLPEEFFFQIHQSFWVSDLYIRHIRYDRLTLDNGLELPISQSFRVQVRERLLRLGPGGDGM